MKKVILLIIVIFLLHGIAYAGSLFGRIIWENGDPLANTVIKIEKKITKTNAFGGYRVNELMNGKRKLKVVFNPNTNHSMLYTSEEITIYSPETKQNWKIYRGNNQLKLIKIK